jgi:hypothetical protein
MRFGLLCVVSVLIFAALPGLAQDANHWGVEADGGVGIVPSSLFESSQNRYKTSGSLSGYVYSVGLVRFHANGAPSYSLDFSGTHVEGNATDTNTSATYKGSTNINGFMATKYVNFVARRRFSIGMGFGAGIAPQLKLDYSKTQTVGTTTTTVNKQYVVNQIPVTPLFQIEFRGDIRVSRNISIGPWGGFRNGLPAAGGAIRVHFLK